MITSGGENIYPVEIENALMTHPDIEDVACIGYPDDRLVEIVLAVVQLKAGKEMTEEELIHVTRGALLHDIGKMAVSDSVLMKEGELIDGEPIDPGGVLAVFEHIVELKEAAAGVIEDAVEYHPDPALLALTQEVFESGVTLGAGHLSDSLIFFFFVLLLLPAGEPGEEPRTPFSIRTSR